MSKLIELIKRHQGSKDFPYQEAKQLMDEKGFDVNSQNEDKLTALILAIQYGLTDLAVQLIRFPGINLNFLHPLLWAMVFKNEVVVNALLDKFVDVEHLYYARENAFNIDISEAYCSHFPTGWLRIYPVYKIGKLKESKEEDCKNIHTYLVSGKATDEKIPCLANLTLGILYATCDYPSQEDMYAKIRQYFINAKELAKKPLSGGEKFFFDAIDCLPEDRQQDLSHPLSQIVENFVRLTKSDNHFISQASVAALELLFRYYPRLLGDERTFIARKLAEIYITSKPKGELLPDNRFYASFVYPHISIDSPDALYQHWKDNKSYHPFYADIARRRSILYGKQLSADEKINTEEKIPEMKAVRMVSIPEDVCYIPTNKEAFWGFRVDGSSYDSREKRDRYANEGHVKAFHTQLAYHQYKRNPGRILLNSARILIAKFGSDEKQLSDAQAALTRSEDPVAKWYLNIIEALNTIQTEVSRAEINPTTLILLMLEREKDKIIVKDIKRSLTSSRVTDAVKETLLKNSDKEQRLRNAIVWYQGNKEPTLAHEEAKKQQGWGEYLAGFFSRKKPSTPVDNPIELKSTGLQPGPPGDKK